MKIFKLIMLSSALFSLQFCSRDNSEETNYANLSAQEKNDLLFSFEEEKMARDTYIFLNNKWGISQFANIQNSEQSHMNAVENLLKKYNITYQILPQGQFSDANLQTLYNQLTAQGSLSKNQAFQAGAIIEDVDIDDLETLKQHTTNATIVSVYNKLECGSRNHLRSFVSGITNLGDTYTPQFISTTEFQSIMNSANEQCGN
ncbi:DUF2202 domain-containing protein [Candidatus Kaistella beijingensis]|uniref:DUF2202 domain-containing protein n=1 Tax=Candidatus Kaistella beijingensis TaxID=2820270 RepID=UPI001CC466E1|nr:DUF2202 domain-containing protein [Candidatus Kaistella beijingensis]UBB90370.1 DUF2202 domain-containing protein [Candidatus Kaistella beijingensis]